MIIVFGQKLDNLLTRVNIGGVCVNFIWVLLLLFKEPIAKADSDSSPQNQPISERNQTSRDSPCTWDMDSAALNCSHSDIVNFKLKRNKNEIAIQLSSNVSIRVELPANSTAIKRLYLQHNSIACLANDMFSSFQSLEILDLSFNEIVLQSSQPQDCETLTNSHFPADLEGAQDMSPGETNSAHPINAQGYGNNLTTDSNLAFARLLNLKHLNLSNNPLSDIPAEIFAGLLQLIHLDLSFTTISSSELASFHFLEALSLLKTLNMSHAGLEGTSNEGVLLLRDLSHLQSLDLRGNRLLCDCPSQDFIIWISQRHHTSSGAVELFLPSIYPTDFNLTEEKWSINSCLNHLDAKCRKAITKLSPAVGTDGSYHKERLPYNRNLGWYTALALLSMLVAFLIFLCLDKLKRRYYKKCRARVLACIRGEKQGDNYEVTNIETTLTEVRDENRQETASITIKITSFDDVTSATYKTAPPSGDNKVRGFSASSCNVRPDEVNPRSTDVEHIGQQDLHNKVRPDLGRKEQYVLDGMKTSSGLARNEQYVLDGKTVKTMMTRGDRCIGSPTDPTGARNMDFCARPAGVSARAQDHTTDDVNLYSPMWIIYQNSDIFKKVTIIERNPECPLHGDKAFHNTLPPRRRSADT